MCRLQLEHRWNNIRECYKRVIYSCVLFASPEVFVVLYHAGCSVGASVKHNQRMLQEGALNVCFVVLFCTMLAGTVLKLCTVLVQREEFKIYVQQSFLCKNWGYNQIVRRKVSQSKYQQFFIHLTCDLILVHNSWFCFLGFPVGSYAVNWALTINCERLLFHFYFKMTSSAMKLLVPWCVQVVSVPSCRLAHFVLYSFV